MEANNPQGGEDRVKCRLAGSRSRKASGLDSGYEKQPAIFDVTLRSSDEAAILAKVLWMSRSAYPVKRVLRTCGGLLPIQL
jgi:hypothetical protein